MIIFRKIKIIPTLLGLDTFHCIKIYYQVYERQDTKFLILTTIIHYSNVLIPT